MSDTTTDKDLEEEKKTSSAQEGDDEDEDEGDDEGSESEAPPAKDDGDARSAAQKPRNALRVERGPAAVWMRNVWTIAKREISSYFNSPLAYIVISMSLVGIGLWCFYKQGYWQVDRASYTQLFGELPALFCIFTAPLFTMRALSEERRLGTLELLITLPVRDSEVIIGKFLGALSMVTIQIVLLAAYPIAMFIWPFHLGAFDWGPFWAAMFGMVLMAGAGTAIGMMFSGFTESQILSFFATSATLAALFFVGYAVQYVQGWPGDVLSFFSFQSRYEAFAKGVIDTRAVVYFLSIAVLALLVAFRTLESRKWK
jgi:ABC-2 type transport system permease protein